MVWNFRTLDRILRNDTMVLRTEDLLTWLALFHIDGVQSRAFLEILVERTCLQMPLVFSESWLMAEMANGITFRTSTRTELGCFFRTQSTVSNSIQDEHSKLASEVSHDARGKQSDHSKMDNGEKYYFAVTPAKAVAHSSPTTEVQFRGGDTKSNGLEQSKKSRVNAKAGNGRDQWG